MMDPLDQETNTTNDLSEKLLPDNIEPEDDEQVVLDQAFQPITSWSNAERQPSACRDFVFALLFLAHLSVVFGIGMAWGLPAFNYKDEDHPDTPTIRFGGVLWLFLWSFVASVVISGSVLYFMTRFAQFMVQFSVVFSILSNLVLMGICLSHGFWGGALFAFSIFALACFYAWSIWDRLPFATANLLTALTAIHTNWGLFFVQFSLTIVSFGYTMLWMISLIGTYAHGRPKCDEDGNCEKTLSGGTLALFIFALYWTHEVVKNIIHVTVAGVVGSWWFVPDEANSGCSKSINDSLFRSMTYSLGSICMGSLLVALVQVAHYFVKRARDNGSRNTGVLYCIAECLLDTLNKLILYFNKWSYIYVGLYGYSYAEAGVKVMELFESRGWDAIINDQLVNRVLSLVSFVIGGLTGLVSILIIKAHPSLMSMLGEEDAAWMAFFCGLLIGTLVSGILMSVVASAVDTVVVCFAESPLELHNYYPILGQQMEVAWAATYSQEYHSTLGTALV